MIRKLCTQDSSPVQDSPSSSKWICIDLKNLRSDPGLQEKISSYHPNNHDEIRKFYLQKCPYQPVLHEYPSTDFSGKPHQFRSNWYVNRSWLEYSIDKDALFCLYCFLFGQDIHKWGGDRDFCNEGIQTLESEREAIIPC